MPTALLVSTAIAFSPTAPTYHVSVAPKKLGATGENFVCWNIDASANRGFFWRNLSTDTAYGAKLARQASALGRAQAAGSSVLRFGGSGNDYLTYAFGGTPCPEESEFRQCLNETHWKSLLSFTEAADARMIFGLSLNTGHDLRVETDDPGYPYPWDPANARAILKWTIDAKLDHLIMGFELGNEQNTKYTGDQMSHNTAILHNLTLELWPNASRRPALFGPDPHSLHDGSSGASKTLAWLQAWLRGCKARGVPITGVTHHEYIEVDPSEAGFVDPSRLDLSGGVADAVYDAVRAVDKTVGVWGGEVGPHNGGSPVCSHASMRWAVYDCPWSR